MATRADNTQAARFDNVVPTSTYGQRLWSASKEVAGRRLRNFFGVVPGLAFLRTENDAPKLKELTSESGFMASWFRQPYGTPDKPQSLRDMPWDYIEKFQEEIPFYGLREYWYPALESSELGHNEHKTVQLLGDNLVLFRDKDGSPAALENRCPHRSALLSLGDVNIWEIGTITCRYHGMTFNKHGECVAFLADGADSPACGKVKATAYPATEEGGIIWVYMGVKEPKPLLDSMPHIREVLDPRGLAVCHRIKVPYSHLNQLDNTVDVTHVGCLHRTCYLFGDQKMGGGIAYEELPGSGIYAHLRDMGGHGGSKAIDDIRWFMPNLVHHGEEFMEGGVHGLYFWFVPNDAGSFTGWLIGSINTDKVGKMRAKSISAILGRALTSDSLPGMACFMGGDAPMQMSQGRIVRWDNEQLARTDRAVLRVRSMMKEAFKEEQAARRERGLDPLAHRVSRTGYMAA